MVIGIHNITGMFLYYNITYFGDTLPLPKLKVSHSYRYLGKFICNLDDWGNYYNPILEISDVYDYTEDQFRDILLHEMIHHYLIHTKLDLRCSHGKAFKSMAEDFNLRYGTNITVRINIETHKVREGKSNFLKYLCNIL